jgi:hypothetical protein
MLCTQLSSTETECNIATDSSFLAFNAGIGETMYIIWWFMIIVLIYIGIKIGQMIYRR